MMSDLKGMKVVMGVTGGIACAKASSVASLLTKAGADVHVVMTESATKFVTPLTFQSITGNQVHTDMFERPREWNVNHIALAKMADVFLIAPATANFIGKVSSGIADDLLTTTVMATKVPVIIAPAMNDGMYTNPVVQKNIDSLRKLGYRFIGPESGHLACGSEGSGRMSEPDQIFKFLRHVVISQNRPSMRNLKVVITSGPTYEALDPVRFIGNRSSGKMGYALAYAAISRGAEVKLISGPCSLASLPSEIEVVHVESAVQMLEALKVGCQGADIVIGAAAVADYRPYEYSREKIKKSSNQDELSLRLTKNPDVIREARLSCQEHCEKVFVGFAAETSDLMNNAKSKLNSKGLDGIVANDVGGEDSPFGSDYNKVTLISKNADPLVMDRMSKAEIAQDIMDFCVGELERKRRNQ